MMIGNNCYVDVLQNFGNLQTICGNNIVIVNVIKPVIKDGVSDNQFRTVSAKEDSRTTESTKYKKINRMTIKSLVKDVLVRLKLSIRSFV